MTVTWPALALSISSWTWISRLKFGFLSSSRTIQCLDCYQCCLKQDLTIMVNTRLLRSTIYDVQSTSLSWLSQDITDAGFGYRYTRYKIITWELYRSERGVAVRIGADTIINKPGYPVNKYNTTKQGWLSFKRQLLADNFCGSKVRSLTAKVPAKSTPHNRTRVMVTGPQQSVKVVLHIDRCTLQSLLVLQQILQGYAVWWG